MQRNSQETAVISTTLHFPFSFRKECCPAVTTHVLCARACIVCVEEKVCASACERLTVRLRVCVIAGKLNCPLCWNLPDGAGYKPGPLLMHVCTHTHTHLSVQTGYLHKSNQLL